MSFELNLQAIFDDMRECTAQVAADRNAFFRQFPLMPPTISIDDGLVIYISQKGVVGIREIARIYRENSAECRRALPQNEMADLVSRAIGSIIGASVLPGALEFLIPTDAGAFWVSLREQLVRDLAKLDRELTHLFGAWLIQGDAIASVDVGPVRFSLRTQWLSDAVAADILTEDQAHRLCHYWEQGVAIDSPRALTITRSRRPPTRLVHVLGFAQFECSVTRTPSPVRRRCSPPASA
jgi:hypothetical protein